MRVKKLSIFIDGLLLQNGKNVRLVLDIKVHRLMPLKIPLYNLNKIACFIVLGLSACTSHNIALDSTEHDELIAQDLKYIAQPKIDDVIAAEVENPAVPVELDLRAALERGLKYNLDRRVSALETLIQSDSINIANLDLLPDLQASASFVGRTNDAASSSQSVATGTQSLEASQSAEENRRNADLSFNWNLLNVALALYDVNNLKDEERIALERLKRVEQTIERDIYLAYIRALTAQQYRPEMERILAQIRQHLERLDRAKIDRHLSSAQLAEKKTSLLNQVNLIEQSLNDFELSEIELKSLISIPHQRSLKLMAVTDLQLVKIEQNLSERFDALDAEALKNRSEMREEVLKRNIGIRQMRREIYSTFPGLELVATYNYDSNKFLEDTNWGTYTSSITQSLIGLITLKDRYESAENRTRLNEARRHALAAALIAQIRIAVARIGYSLDAYQRSKTSLLVAQEKFAGDQEREKLGMLSRESLLFSKLQMNKSSLDYEEASIALEEAKLALHSSLGRDLLTQIKIRSVNDIHTNQSEINGKAF